MTGVYDLAVVGGGIQGVGVAQAAAAAGYQTILFEQSQLAAGTSSRSSKLIHGGLRYLESGQFGLVRKALCERALLLRLAPELVRLVPFYIPIYPDTKRRGWQIRIGLSMYAALGKFSRDSRFNSLDNKAIEALLLKDKASLQCVYQYYDAQTDDRELTKSVMYSAMELGAELVCPAKVIHIQKAEEQFVIQFEENGQQKECTSKTVVNAAGPWVNELLGIVKPGIPHLEMDLVQGTHLVLNEPSPEGIYYVEAPGDRRAVFIMPWQGYTMVGTTERNYQGDPSATRPSQPETDYLLEVYRHYFDGNSTIRDSFSGLRVLPKTEHSYFHRPRDTVLYQHASQPGLLSMYGGKLTGYRATALQVMEKLQPLLPATNTVADTAQLELHPVTNSLC